MRTEQTAEQTTSKLKRKSAQWPTEARKPATREETNYRQTGLQTRTCTTSNQVRETERTKDEKYLSDNRRTRTTAVIQSILIGNPIILQNEPKIQLLKD